MKRMETDVVVVGTGPGGATVARELVKKGREVVIVEKGRWHEFAVGRYLSLGSIMKIFFSKERGIMAKGITVGGSSLVNNACAYDPPGWLATELDIQLDKYVSEARAEIGIQKLPQSFYDQWPHTKLLMESAAELGIHLGPVDKFIDSTKCDPACDDCILGCRRQAKWTAREFVSEATAGGARLLARTPVTGLIIEQDRAVGVKVRGPDGIKEVRADKVVLSAGGIGTAEILLKEGFEGAGEGFFIDPMNVVFGVGSAPGPKNEPTFSVVSSDFMESDGYIIGNLGWTPLMSGVPLFFRYFGKSKNIMGLFAKISDSSGGRITADGKIEKPYTDEDQQKFDKGKETCEKILIQAGANPKSLHVIHNIGGHPGGTAAIGRVVDKDLKANQTENLYVCDSSVLPRSPGCPPTLTLIGLGKRLASQI